jgi:hypothetical protein
MMPVRDVRRLFMRPGLVVLRRFLVMVSGVLEVFSCLPVMFGSLLRHVVVP